MLRVPSLRARRGDVLDWIERLWRAWFRDRGRSTPTLTWKPAAAALIVNHPWRDNLRGLDRLVHEQAMRGASATAVDATDLPTWLTTAAPPPERTVEPAIAIAAPAAARTPVPSRDAFVQVWAELGGSVRAVAKHFGRDRRQIYRWLDSHGLRSEAIDD